MPALSQHTNLSIPDSASPGVFDVTADPYFAAGDGVTNDTAAINRAIADINLLGLPAVLYFRTGNYLVTDPLDEITPANVTVCGDPGFTSRILQNGTSGRILFATGRYSTITDLFLECTNEVADGSYSVVVNCPDSHVDRVIFWDVGGVVSWGQDSSRCEFTGCYGRVLEEMDWDWVRVLGSPGLKMTNYHFTGGKCIVPSGAYLSVGRADPGNGTTDVTDGAFFEDFQFFCEPAVRAGATLINGTQTLSTTPSTLTVDSTAAFDASGQFNIGAAGAHRVVTYTGKTGTTFTGCTVSSGSSVYSDNTECRQYIDGSNGTLCAKPYGFWIDARIAAQNNLRFINYGIDGTSTGAIRILADSNVTTSRVHHFMEGRAETCSGRIMHISVVAGGTSPVQNIFAGYNRWIWGNDVLNSDIPITLAGSPTTLDEINITNNMIDQKITVAARSSVISVAADNFTIGDNIFGNGSTTAANTNTSYWVNVVDDSTQFILGPNTGNPPTVGIYNHFAYTTVTNGRHVLGRGSLVGPVGSNNDRRASALASAVPTAAFDTMIAEVQILTLQKATGLRYRVGGVANGDALGMLYDAAGNLLAQSAAIAQSGGNNIDTLPFATALYINPGTYLIAIQLSSITGTWQASAAFVNARRTTAGSMAAQATITPPTIPFAGGGVPALALY